MDRLAGIFNDADFQRIFLKIKSDRSFLEDKIEVLEEQRKSQRPGKKPGKRFIDCTCTKENCLSARLNE